MLTAEETVCNQEANMQKLMHELESKDAELEELVMNIEEMETRGGELEGLVQLLEVSKSLRKYYYLEIVFCYQNCSDLL